MLISESVIKNAVRQAINEMINEDRTELPNGAVEVDNFEPLKEIMKFDKPGDTLYFIQIKKRDKDNPGQRSKFQAAMHLKEYYIKSIQELEAVEDEIKDICKRERARAYIWLNSRSKAVVDTYTKRNMSYWKKHPHEGYKYGWKAQALAAAKSLDIDERPLCFIDVDSDDQNDINMTMKIIQDAGIKPLYAYRSLNNGIHIILPNKEDAKKLDFSPINGNLKGASRKAQMNAKVGIEIDKPALLYACLIPQGYGRQQARFAKFTGQTKKP